MSKRTRVTVARIQRNPWDKPTWEVRINELTVKSSLTKREAMKFMEQEAKKGGLK